MFRYIRSKKKRRIAYIVTIIIIALIIIAIFSYQIYIKFTELVSTRGHVRMEVDKLTPIGNTVLITLRGDCSELSFYISPEQASAIEAGLSQTRGFRPMTHDITIDMMEGFGVNPLLLKITKLEENTYYADLILQKWNRFLVLDIRPSDGIALVSRTGVPIYVNEDLVTKIC